MRVWLIRIWVYVGIAALALIAAATTTMITPTVHNVRELRAVRYGYPFHFVTSDVVRSGVTPGKKDYPVEIPFNPRENPSEFHLDRLLASAGVIAALPLLLMLAFELRSWRRNAAAPA